MKKLLFTAIIFVLLKLCAFSQNPELKRAWNWYFGKYAALNFSSGTAVPLFNSASWCGPPGAISDTSGNLQFYNGNFRIWNKNHQYMNTNPIDYLKGDSYSQMCLIVPQPENNDIYYIFYCGYDYDTNPVGDYCVFYSTVDMSLNGGLGGLVEKNKILLKDGSRRIAAVKHKNEIDVWIITSRYDTSRFNSYLLTSQGIDTVPVVSYAGQYHWVANLFTSPSGNMLVSSFIMDNNIRRGVEIYDFDRSTGIISNPVRFHDCHLSPPGNCQATGVAFSPDGTKLYYVVNYVVTMGASTMGIYQVDISSRDSAQIIDSKVLLDTLTINDGMNGFKGASIAIQLAPDGKIYLTRDEMPFIGVINYPNLQGLACNLIPNAISIDDGTGRWCGRTFPTFPNFMLPNDSIVENHTGSVFKKPDLQFIPNPFNTTSTLTLPENIQNTDNLIVKLYDLTGKQYNIKYEMNYNQLTLHRENLDAGVYFVEILINNEFTGTTKLIIH
jgi:hypothetical protein